MKIIITDSFHAIFFGGSYKAISVIDQMLGPPRVVTFLVYMTIMCRHDRLQSNHCSFFIFVTFFSYKLSQYGLSTRSYNMSAFLPFHPYSPVMTVYLCSNSWQNVFHL